MAPGKQQTFPPEKVPTRGIYKAGDNEAVNVSDNVFKFTIE